MGEPVKLLPCPFCGESKRVYDDKYIRDGRQVECWGCGASVAAFLPDANAKAIAKWNTRAMLAAAPSHTEGEDGSGTLSLRDAQIKHMVDRFLAWRLPENFSPDAGINFKPEFNEGTSHPMRHEPIGTNLFDAMQAEAMVRHMVEGMPLAEEQVEQVARALYECERARSDHCDAVIAAGRGQPVGKPSMEPFDECRDMFMEDARAALSVVGGGRA